MKRRGMGSRLLVALLVGTMVFSTAKMPVMATEGGEEPHEYAAPTNPRWDPNRHGYGMIDIVDSTRGYVVAELLLDGRRIYTHGGSISATTIPATLPYDFGQKMDQSGTYTFRVKMSADNSDSSGARDMSYGAVSEMSVPYVYTRPSEVVAKPGNPRWSSTEPGVALWDPVVHAAGYFAWLERDGEQTVGLYAKEGENSIDFSDRMADADEHSYRFYVKALSKDIERYANSDYSDSSDVYIGTSESRVIQDNIANAANADESTVNDAVNQLKNENDVNAMCSAIQNSEATQQNLSTLENTYNQKNGINVNRNSEVGSIPTSGMSVIGAGLNATAGSTVTLNVTATPREPEYDTDIYTNVISFDMKLVDENGNTRPELTQLSIPAVITLPIPAGMNTADLFILHFMSNGSYEKITPAIIDSGTKAKFTITSFSTFAFANKNSGKHLVWETINGKSYWYENGVKQGTYNDPKGVEGDGTIRGREIYDPASHAWYWLDSVYDGAKACGKEVWMPYIYQDEGAWKYNEVELNNHAVLSGADAEDNAEHAELAEQVRRAIQDGTGKWVRYDNEGKMLKGWVTIKDGLADLYPDQAGNRYYYDRKTGLMAKGRTVIDGQEYYFDEITGVLQQ